MSNAPHNNNVNLIAPQPGFQQKVLASPADVLIMGGSAGCGKSMCLLMEPLRYVQNPKFAGIILRREYVQIKLPGGLWDKSVELFSQLPGSVRPQMKFGNLEHVFPSGAKVAFDHIQQEQSVYRYQGPEFAYIAFDELTHFCMHPDTDVLTEFGWMKIADVLPGTKVASLSPERQIEYISVQESHSFDYDNDLITVNQKNGIAFKVTPNHKTVVDRQNKAGTWKFVRADKLETSIQTIPRTGSWEGGKEVEYYELPRVVGRGHGTNTNQTDRIKMDDWLEFLGWYYSEGCAFERNNRSGTPLVTIRQMKPNDSLLALFDRLPFRTFISKDGQYSIFSRQLYNEVKPLGSLYEKRVPRWVFGLSKRQIQIFFDAFVQGDGHVYEDGSIGFGLANSGLIDDLQEICFLLGRIATKGESMTKTGFKVYRLSVSTPKRSGTMIKHKDVSREHYTGKVYCLTVPKNHTFYCRVNGRTFWTGNTAKQFFYLLTRSRSTSGIDPLVRASTNPQGEGWVKELIAWYIYPDDYPDETKRGFPIPERSGVLRYFVQLGNEIKSIVWGLNRWEVWQQLDDGKRRRLANMTAAQWEKLTPEKQFEVGQTAIRSFSFIFGLLADNPKLTAATPGYVGSILAQDEETQAQLLDGRWSTIGDDSQRLYLDASIADLFTNSFVRRTGQRYITADIALEGSDRMVVIVWDGWVIVDIKVYPKTDGARVFTIINETAKRWSVPGRNIAFDADGAGGFLKGFLKNSFSFVGGARPMADKRKIKDGRPRPNYDNLRAQVYFYFRDMLDDCAVFCSVDDGSLQTEIRDELRAIKKMERANNGKLAIIPKVQIKALLKRSPDIADAIVMRSVFELSKPAARASRKVRAIGN